VCVLALALSSQGMVGLLALARAGPASRRCRRLGVCLVLHGLVVGVLLLRRGHQGAVARLRRGRDRLLVGLEWGGEGVRR
jgi:hypothetical protein